MTQTIAIDFDGVIHAYSQGWVEGTIYDKIVPGAINSILEIQQQYAVVIFTTRDPGDVARWMGNQGFGPVTTKWETRPFWNNQNVILVTNIKPAALIYIDDRALHFQNWPQAMRSVRRLNIPEKTG